MDLAEAKGHTGDVVIASIVLSVLFFPLAMPLLPIVLIFAMEDRNKASGRRAAPGRHKHTSYLERIMHYRRNALLGIYFGLPVIALGIFFVVFRVGIFWDPANEKVLGIFVFLAGYAAVIAGCCYWLKAKALHDAIVCIGLAPLAIPFIPFGRLIFRMTPGILPLGMVMMPLVLIVVIWALDNKSGVPGPRRPWDWHRAGLRWRPSGSVAAQRVGVQPASAANRNQEVGSEANRPSEAAGSDG